MGLMWFEKDGETRLGARSEAGITALTGQDMVAALAETPVQGAAVSDPVTALPPVTPTAKILCVALNYVDHAKEANQPVPETPIVFFKTFDAMIAGGAPIRAPRMITQLDYEGELALIIGKRGFDIAKTDAWDHIAGVTTLNDVSARDIFKVKAGAASHLDWFSGKCLNQSTPIGPEVFPLSAIEDDLKAGTTRIRCLVNGEVRQDAPVADMIFDIPTMIAFISSRIPLNPGDIIATGTPPGVGAGTDRYLSKGDVVRVEVTGLPPMENTVA
ncbi:fumarylacetoacetate hydrolase family protein [Jannaschia sp. CCS1]|uniref:fumarylacetoacetate hydrolase family protein n=1 Tax=Jannaschia sp. (strain CCS1) TaxID=290400 RepID=UPI000053ABF6|nr:fumarylacetoacetate hydrolase family protein [Jannaschia sp. CCS1]ABD53786.1 5-carboxymethyl-2-hydroxymuconate delta-isomerase [Jannaschia sp. CCS1]